MANNLPEKKKDASPDVPDVPGQIKFNFENRYTLDFPNTLAMGFYGKLSSHHEGKGGDG